MAEAVDKKEVEAILQRLQGSAARPTSEELFAPFTYLGTTFVSSRNEGSSTSARDAPHWYCSKCPESLHREAATFLIFLFAYAKSDNAQLWLRELEGVLQCEGCARGFGIAKRRFKRKYFATYPAAVTVNFFAAVNKYTIDFIERYATPRVGLDEIQPHVANLILSEASFVDQPLISGIIERTKDYDKVAASGLRPLLVKLSAKEAKWSVKKCSRQPTAYRSWCDEGVGQEVQALYSGEPGRREWSAVAAILKHRTLAADALEQGLLGGAIDGSEGSKGTGLMAALVPRLSGSSPEYQSIFQCFGELLQVCPNEHIWSFDTSPELPHTLFASIKNNPSFIKLLEWGEMRGEALQSIKPYLLSLLGSAKGDSDKSAFGETLAKAANWTFSEMQHSRVDGRLRADVSRAGFEALIAVEEAVDRESNRFLELSATLDIHATFIANVAFREQDYPGGVWHGAREAARKLISTCFHADNNDAMDSAYALAILAAAERGRRARKAKDQKVPEAQTLDKLHQAASRKSLWAAVYNAISPRDPDAIALLMQTIAQAAHFDLLDAERGWGAKHLSEMVDPKAWLESVNAVNVALKSSREHFAQTIESFSLQPQESLLHDLFAIPGVAHSAMLLLLSPDDSVNEAILSLIQQTFDVDDRSEAFRALLRKYPMEAVDALSISLQSFSMLAQKTPESCSLAKRLVRCFFDIVEALCSSTDGDVPLLISDTFMSAHRSDTNMRRQISHLWHLMNTALAVIYKRTPQWAVWFENSVMTDWMRDALILGSQLCDKVRMFESAVLGVTGPSVSESPAKVSNSGRTLVSKLHVVLRDLTLWLRLTDVEILYQTFNLIKVILQRTAKANFEVASSPELQESVSSLSKFVSRPTKSFSSKLSEDRISELSELLAPFTPSIEDEVEFLSITPARSSPASSPPRDSASSSKEKRNALEDMMEKARRKGKYLPGERKDAFAEMMRSSQGSSSKYKAVPPKEKETSKLSKTIEVDDDDDFDDSFLDNLSNNDLDVIEKRAKISATSGQSLNKPRPSSSTLSNARAAVPAHKLNINVVPRPVSKPSGGSAMSKLMRETRRDWSRPNVGGVTPMVPTASSVGTGLGAYQPKPAVVARPDSDTSDDDSDSDDGGGGMSQLITTKKAVIQYQPETVRPKLRYTDDAVHLEMRKRQLEKERHARRQKRLKPDLGPLFRFVLSWDPTSTDPQPPHPDKIKLQFGEAVPIPAAFTHADQYDRVMLPLFLQELWAQSLNDKGADQDIAVEVTSRSYEDDWIDVELAVIGPWPDRVFLNETDIVMLSQPGNPKKVFARIQGVKKTFKQANIKVRIAGSMDVSTLLGKMKWLLRKHISLSTALREFGALRGLPFFEPEMLRDILGGKSAHLPIMNDSEVQRTMKTYDVNEPQAKAILGSTRIEGFALIQGPPGTGKTKTISGLVGKWMSDRPNVISAPHGNTAKKQKLLVCAPSNAAIDEVCKRLMMGVPTASGEQKVPMIVRLGIDNSVHDAVKDRSLDNLVEARVSNTGGKGDTSEYGRLQAELEDIKGKIHSVQQQLSVVKNDEKRKELEVESHNLNTKRVQLGKQSSKAKDAMRDANRHLDGARRAAKTAVLEEADIVCATLSGAGQEILAAHEFETVIIDEAAQAIELACLIPLKYGCKRCIMVGDPNQLPPTTFSPSATRLRYNESLFVRMANLQPQNMHLLSIQYRMHPDISKLPSKLFYKSKLSDGPDMAGKTAALWHERNVFGPYRFFDVRGQEERAVTSTKNRMEAQVAVQLYKALGQDFGSKINLNMRVGIISMYREQIHEIRRSFVSAFGQEINSAVEFNTVDGFQGQEKDIIILSTVRSGLDLQSIGFLRDFRRMNVALTRAKSSLFVIGNADTLSRCDDMWRTIVGDARDRGYLIKHTDATFKSLAPPPKPKPKPVEASTPAMPVERIPLKRKPSPPASTPLAKKPKEGSAGPSSRPTNKCGRAGSTDSSDSSDSESDGGLDALLGKKAPMRVANGASSASTANGQGSIAPSQNARPPPARPPPPAMANGQPAHKVNPSRPPPPRNPVTTPAVPMRPPPPIVHRPPAVVAAEVAFRTKRKKKLITGAVRPPYGSGAGPSMGPR